MKKMFGVFLLVFLVAVSSVWAEGLTPYNNAEEGFSISFPSDWDVKTGYMGTSAIAFSRQAGPLDNFRENVNVVTEEILMDLTPKQYFDRNLVTMKKALPEFNAVSSSIIEKNGVNFILLESTYKMGKFDVKAMALFGFKDKKGYVVTATALKDTYDEFKPVMAQILDSFGY